MHGGAALSIYGLPPAGGHAPRSRLPRRSTGIGRRVPEDRNRTGSLSGGAAAHRGRADRGPRRSRRAPRLRPDPPPRRPRADRGSDRPQARLVRMDDLVYVFAEGGIYRRLYDLRAARFASPAEQPTAEAETVTGDATILTPTNRISARATPGDKCPAVPRQDPAGRGKRSQLRLFRSGHAMILPPEPGQPRRVRAPRARTRCLVALTCARKARDSSSLRRPPCVSQPTKEGSSNTGGHKEVGRTGRLHAFARRGRPRRKPVPASQMYKPHSME